MPESASSSPSDNTPSQEPEAEGAVEEAPMNRAERRAKGKHKDAQQFGVNKIHPGRVNPSHAQRQYSNRRSGG